jgi:hypothetical protein
MFDSNCRIEAYHQTDCEPKAPQVIAAWERSCMTLDNAPRCALAGEDQ